MSSFAGVIQIKFNRIISEQLLSICYIRSSRTPVCMQVGLPLCVPWSQDKTRLLVFMIPESLWIEEGRNLYSKIKGPSQARILSSPDESLRSKPQELETCGSKDSMSKRILPGKKDQWRPGALGSSSTMNFTKSGEFKVSNKSRPECGEKKKSLFFCRGEENDRPRSRCVFPLRGINRRSALWDADQYVTAEYMHLH